MPPLALFGNQHALSFIAWRIALARYVLPELRPSRAQTPCSHSSCCIVSASSAYRSWQPAWSRRTCRLPGQFPLPTGSHCRRAGFAGAGSAEGQVGNCLGLGVQPLGQRRSALRLLSGQSGWARAGPAGCRLLHRDRARAAAPHHARACVLAPVTARRSGRIE